MFEQVLKIILSSNFEKNLSRNTLVETMKGRNFLKVNFRAAMYPGPP